MGMSVLVGVLVGGGGGGSQIVGVMEGGGSGSHTIGNNRQPALAPPSTTIIAKMAFCRSLGILVHGTMVTLLSRPNAALYAFSPVRQLWFHFHVEEVELTSPIGCVTVDQGCVAYVPVKNEGEHLFEHG